MHKISSPGLLISSYSWSTLRSHIARQTTGRCAMCCLYIICGNAEYRQVVTDYSGGNLFLWLGEAKLFFLVDSLWSWRRIGGRCVVGFWSVRKYSAISILHNISTKLNYNVRNSPVKRNPSWPQWMGNSDCYKSKVSGYDSVMFSR